jgi:CHAD domain-containing protein
MNGADHAERWALDGRAALRGVTEGGRPRLRLIPRAVAELGPISPELVLVCPELAAAAREALPDPPWSRPAPGALTAAAEPLDPATPSPLAQRPVAEQGMPGPAGPPDRPDEGDPGPVSFDTADLRLSRHGICLERRVRGGSPSWKLVLPRGEVMEAVEEARDGHPPAEIAALLRAVAGEERLLPVPRYSDDADLARLQAQVWEQRDAMLRHDPGARLGTDPENLHQFRVASRRLRAFLRVARQLVDTTWAASLGTQLGELGRAGGPVRDLDVLLEQLQRELQSLDPGELPAAQALIAALGSERDRLQQMLLVALAEPAYLRLLDRLALPIQASAKPPRISLRRLAARELRRLVRDVQKLGGSPDDEALHALRIKVKRVRYAVELGGEPTRPRTERVIGAAKTLQDLLGEHRDTVVAERLLADLAGRNSNASLAFVAGRLAERQRFRRQRLAEQLPSAWKQLRRAARKLR